MVTGRRCDNYSGAGTFQQRGIGAVAAVKMPGAAAQTSGMELIIRAAVAN